MIGVGMVILYVLYKKYYATDSEETSGAGGDWWERDAKKPCFCQGVLVGNMRPKLCKRKCNNANNF